MDLHSVEDIFDITQQGVGIIQNISALEAFRRYNWLRDAPVVNAAGNYRGIVISSEWRAVYVYSSSIAEKAGNIAILLSVCDELMKSRKEITTIMNGNDDRYTKAAKLSSQVSGIALRVLAHLAIGTISGLDWALRITRWVNPGYLLNPKQFMKTLDSVDQTTVWLEAQADSYFSGGNLYYFATIVAHPIDIAR